MGRVEPTASTKRNLGHERGHPVKGSSCQACGAGELSTFYEVRGIPVQTTVLLQSEDQARDYPRGDLLLALCQNCGLIQNVLFEPQLVDYSLPTEESQGFSPLFAEYASDLAQRLVVQHALRGRKVLEIGSGKGEFLGLMAEAGIGTGVGIDPGFLPERAPQNVDSLEFRREFYGREHVDQTGDLIVARHLLEHVPNVREFLRWLAQSTARTRNAQLFIEVPDVARVLSEGAFWDVYYEHCSYFTSESMRLAVLAAGMTPLKVEHGFDGQYILAWAESDGAESSGKSQEAWVESMFFKAEKFKDDANDAVQKWRLRIENELDRGREVVVWGASSKAVAFLAGIDIAEVTVVDINPHKQGKWLPGVAIEVEAPKALAARSPALVIPMNPTYVREIRADLRRMDLEPDLEAVG